MGPCDFRLIELIRQNRHLYDRRHPDFRNLEKKEITWRAIAAAQGSTAEICRTRFRSLRDRFVREKRQNKQQLLDGTASNPIWLKMMFLWDHLRPTRRKFTWNQPKHKRSLLHEHVSSDPEVDSPDLTQDHSEAEKLAAEHEQTLSEIEEQNVGRHHVDGESVTDATRKQEATARLTKKYRPIRPKPDPRSNPIIVNLTSSESRNFGNRARPGTSEAESDACEEMGDKSTEGRMMSMSSSVTTPRQPSQNKDDEDSFSSQISCNDAFCLMLKDSLDQVTNPLKLSLLRIKIMTILHNEVYS